MSHRTIPNIVEHHRVCLGCGLRTNNLNVIAVHTDTMLDKPGRCPDWRKML